MAKGQISVRVDPTLVRQAQRVLKARTKTQAIERSLATVVELERHRRVIRRFSGTGRPDDFQLS